MEDFEKDPRYQKLKAKLLRATPDQRAILSGLALDQGFADEQERKRLAALTASYGVQKAKTDLSERASAFDLAMANRASQDAFNNEQADAAANLQRWNLMATGGLGLFDALKPDKSAQLIKDIHGLYKRQGLLAPDNPYPTNTNF